MKKYILVSCVERELLIPDVFDTFNEANNQMMEEFRKALKYQNPINLQFPIMKL